MRAPLARVVDDDDGELVAALQLAQVGEQRRDLAGDVLVDAVQADEGIEDEEPGPQRGDGVGERLAGRSRGRAAATAR